VFDWPASGELNIPAFDGTVQSAKLLGAPGAKVTVQQAKTASGFTIRVPSSAPDPIASVIALDMADRR
jgi:hypothetical protein